jgi:hypothetical protein
VFFAVEAVHFMAGIKEIVLGAGTGAGRGEAGQPRHIALPRAMTGLLNAAREGEGEGFAGLCRHNDGDAGMNGFMGG